MINNNVFLPNKRINSLEFRGITGILSKKVLSHKTIDELTDLFPNSEAKVGSIPGDWVREIPREERSQKIQDIYHGLNDTHGCLMAGETKEAGHVLSNSLTQAGVSVNEPASFERLDRGDMGTAYKLELRNKKYVFKAFDDTIRHYENEHGPLIEANNGMIVRKRYGNCQLPYVYLADLRDGWILSKYREPETKPAKVIDFKKEGISHNDSIGANRLPSGHITDLGGMAFKNHPRNIT